MSIPLKYVKIDHSKPSVDSLITTVEISTSLLPNCTYKTTVRNMEDINPQLSKILKDLTHGYSVDELKEKLDHEPEIYDTVIGVNQMWNKHYKIIALGDNPFRKSSSLYAMYELLEINSSPWEQVKNNNVKMPMIKQAFDRGFITLEDN